MIANFLNIFHWSRDPSKFLEKLITPRFLNMTVQSFEITNDEVSVSFFHKESEEGLNLSKTLKNSQAETRLNNFLMIIHGHLYDKHLDRLQMQRESFKSIWGPIADTYLAVLKDCGIPLKKWELERLYLNVNRIVFLPDELDWTGYTHKLTLYVKEDYIQFVNDDFTLTYNLPKGCARNPEVLMEDEELKLIEKYFSRKIHQYYYGISLKT